jgi:hypothetical protein
MHQEMLEMSAARLLDSLLYLRCPLHSLRVKPPELPPHHKFKTNLNLVLFPQCHDNHSAPFPACRHARSPVVGPRMRRAGLPQS